uniref:mRNA (guanine-N(7))-methyltransferase n=1 Tax=Trypanosoma vivax (strain Y486) TaxID=1055687 RepID=G0TXZ7_TRYVY|nr:putative methyltransferase, fragment [Trypanosoma vivax Y486]
MQGGRHVPSVDSLYSLYLATEGSPEGKLCVPVDEEFVRAIHTPQTEGSASHQGGVDGGNFLSVYNSLLQRNILRKSGGNSDANDKNRTAWPGVPKLIHSYASEAVLGSREGEFMGPLCSPIRKTHAAMLRANPYLVTEKSDGMRVVLVSLLASAIPSWSLRRTVASDAQKLLRIDDVVALEEVRQQLGDGKTSLAVAPQVRLSFGCFLVEVNAAVGMENSSERLNLSLRPCMTEPSSHSAGECGITVERELGTRHMTYCFDRSMTSAYLLMQENNAPSLRAYALDAELMLLATREKLDSPSSSLAVAPQVRLSFGCFLVEVNAAVGMENSSERLNLSLRPCMTEPSSHSAGECGITVERELGTRHMTYCFDRSMTSAYLLMQENNAPSLRAYALDAELMLLATREKLDSPSLLLGCFDLFRYTSIDTDGPIDVRLTRAPMSERYAALKNVVVEPLKHHQSRAVGALVLQFFTKEMVPLERFAECVARLQRVSNNNCTCGVSYLYNGPYGLTRSDGFIFTPETFNLMHGASKEQVKWKWPSMLSVDWSLIAVEGQKDRYIVDLFFRKKRFGHRPDSTGRVRLSSNMRLLNPSNILIPTGSSVIAECVFDQQRRCWSVERIRTDKSEPNSVVTIISVLESLVENISLGVLIAYLYNGPYGLTRSDGFIFTPETFNLMHGASKEQVKWKWPSMLSVDWSLIAVEGQKDRYIVDLFFRKKRFGHRPDSTGRVRLSSNMRLLNPSNILIPTGSSVIAECVFDQQRRCWSVERIRTDKSEPNSVVTIISVLESLVENISLGVLIKLIGVTDDLLSSERVRELEEVEQDLDRKEHNDQQEELPQKDRCQLTLRATQLQTQGAHEIHLYWSVRLASEKQHIPCVHCKVRDCTGLGFACPIENAESPLTEHLYIALANAGGSYAWSDFTVDVAFDGRSGRWNILSLEPNGDNKKSHYLGVIHHLQWLLKRRGDGGCAEVPDTAPHKAPLTAPLLSEPHVKTVSAHYALRTRELSSGKDRSLLRHYNNWTKSVLIATTVSLLTSQRCGKSAEGGLAVADICCGRGGDLHKWKVHKPQFLFMVDCCLEAVAEAAARYSVSKGLSLKVAPNERNGSGVRAHFCTCDVFGCNEALVEQLGLFYDRHLHERRFDVVSCQFSIHYGCVTEEVMRTFLQTVASALRSGGIFVGTTVNDSELLRRAREQGPTFGNGMYSVHFSSEPPPSSSFGQEYSISVEKSVDRLSEFVVPWNRIVDLCAAVGLQVRESFGFLEYGNFHYNSDLGRNLRDTTCGPLAGVKRDTDGHALLRLSPEEEEVAGLFRTFLFQKN